MKISLPKRVKLPTGVDAVLNPTPAELKAMDAENPFHPSDGKLLKNHPFRTIELDSGDIYVFPAGKAQHYHLVEELDKKYPELADHFTGSGFLKRDRSGYTSVSELTDEPNPMDVL